MLLQEQHKDEGLEVLGISLEAGKEQMQRARAELKTPWRQICDAKGPQSETALRWNVPQVPCMVVIGRDGKIAALNLDPTYKDGARDLEQAIDAALKAGK